MMNRLKVKKMAYRLSKPFPLKWMRQLSGQHFIFPFYHLATDHPPSCIKHLFPVVSEKQFGKDLEFLLRHYSPAGLSDVLNFLKQGKQTHKPRFFLSFDDGFAACFHVVAPLLKAKGIPAAFFINPLFVDNRQLSHRQQVSLIVDKILRTNHTGFLKEASKMAGLQSSDKHRLIGFIKKQTIADADLIQQFAHLLEIDFEQVLHASQPYMSTAQIRHLQSEGFVIGSHSLDHTEFNLLTMKEMKEQIEKSFRFLESELNTSSRLFSFPFSDIGVPHSFFSYLTQKANVAVSFGTSGLKRDDAPCHLQRIPFELPGFNGAEEILRSEYFYYFGKAFPGKNRIKR